MRALAWTRTVSRVRPLTVDPAVACRIDADSGQILGCAVFGTEGGEIMTMIRSR